MARRMVVKVQGPHRGKYILAPYVLSAEIIGRVVKQYIESGDFNGLPATALAERFALSEEEIKRRLEGLIRDDTLAISLYVNPHIRAFDDPTTKQIEGLKAMPLSGLVVYPTRATLARRVARLRKYRDRRFSRILLEGFPQMHPCYFELPVLERYTRDPRYRVFDDGTTMSLSMRSEYCLDSKTSEEDKIGIQTLSYAYRTSDQRKVVLVFLRYLHDLSPRHQKQWESHQVFGDFRLDKDYVNRSFRVEFTENRSIYEAFLEEQRQGNLLSKTISKPHFFRKVYDANDLPVFNRLLRPTLNSYHEFVLTLEKVFPGNINAAFFKGDIAFTDEQGADISQHTIKLLEKWLTKFYRPRDPKALEEPYNALRRIRAERQRPAHAIDPDKYDETYFEKQRDLIVSAYRAIEAIRLIFSSHPKAKAAGYQPPDWIEKGKIKL